MIPLIPLAAFVLASAPGPLDDWDSFRGPRRDAISAETNWKSEGAKEPLWEAQLGLGYSACTVVDGRLYSMGFDREKEEDVIVCLDAQSGEEIWNHRFPAKIWNQLHGGGTLSTPTLHGGVAYVQNREGNLFALDAVSGEVQWHRLLSEDHELTTPTWGFGASPLIHGKDLLINVGRVLCLDPATGKDRWSSKDYGHSYAAIAPFTRKGAGLLAVFNGDGLAVLSDKDGSEKGFLEWKAKYEINAAAPLVIEDKLFISSGIGRGCALIQVTDGGLETIWENKVMSVKMTSAIHLGESLYGFDGAVFTCMGLDGSAEWIERGLGNGSVLGTPDRLIVISGKGELIVLEANPAEFKALSRKQLFGGAKEKEVYWTRPTLVDGLIYVRSSLGHLVCRDHRGER